MVLRPGPLITHSECHSSGWTAPLHSESYTTFVCSQPNNKLGLCTTRKRWLSHSLANAITKGKATKHAKAAATTKRFCAAVWSVMASKSLSILHAHMAVMEEPDCDTDTLQSKQFSGQQNNCPFVSEELCRPWQARPESHTLSWISAP